MMRPVDDGWGVWRVLVTGQSASYYVRRPGHEQLAHSSKQDYRRWRSREAAQHWIDEQQKGSKP